MISETFNSYKKFALHLKYYTLPMPAVSFSARTHLSQRLCVRGHVGEDDEDVLLALVGEVLGGGERQARRDDPLDGGVVRQVQEQADVLHGTVLLEVLERRDGDERLD